MPDTPEKWRAAVDAAEFLLLVDSARLYGLVSGGPRVNADRCETILRRGRQLGYRPRPHRELIADLLPQFVDQYGEEMRRVR